LLRLAVPCTTVAILRAVLAVEIAASETVQHANV
jgi:hypothetical protein